MDPIRLLKQDHRRVRVLFRRFQQAKSNSDRQKVGEEIIEELSVHAAIEEQLVYPLLRAAGGKRGDEVLIALEEHHAIKLVLAELDNMNADAERYTAKMHVVREAIEAHVREEEEQQLPRLERLLDPQRAEDMVEAMRLMKAAVPNHPHPLAPDEPPGNLVAAILSKMSDSGKDLIRKLTDSDRAEGHRRVAYRASANVRAATAARQNGGRKTAPAH